MSKKECRDCAKREQAHMTSGSHWGTFVPAAVGSKGGNEDPWATAFSSLFVAPKIQYMNSNFISTVSFQLKFLNYKVSRGKEPKQYFINEFADERLCSISRMFLQLWREWYWAKVQVIQLSTVCKRSYPDAGLAIIGDFVLIKFPLSWN